MCEKGGMPDDIVEKRNWWAMTDPDEIAEFCDGVVERWHKQLEQYAKETERKQKKLLDFFVNQVVVESEYRIDPEAAEDYLRVRLEFGKRTWWWELEDLE